jgi:hypothetical protein
MLTVTALLTCWNLLRHCGDRRQNRSSEQQGDYHNSVDRRSRVVPAPRLVSTVNGEVRHAART